MTKRRRNLWIISDTHFFHENILEYAKRPFKNVREMNEYIVDAWRSRVEPGDLVYHLGDVTFHYGEDFRKLWSSLPGRKRLVLGNHDDAEKLRRNFSKIMESRQLPDEGAVMTHRPIVMHKEHPKWLWNIHGHIHEKDLGSPMHFNASVERIGFKPLLIEDILKKNGRGK